MEKDHAYLNEHVLRAFNEVGLMQHRYIGRMTPGKFNVETCDQASSTGIPDVWDGQFPNALREGGNGDSWASVPSDEPDANAGDS